MFRRNLIPGMRTTLRAILVGVLLLGFFSAEVEAQVTLTSPANGASLSSEPTFAWSGPSYDAFMLIWVIGAATTLQSSGSSIRALPCLCPGGTTSAGILPATGWCWDTTRLRTSTNLAAPSPLQRSALPEPWGGITVTAMRQFWHKDSHGTMPRLTARLVAAIWRR